MGRVVPFRAVYPHGPRPPANGRARWDASLVIAEGAMRTPSGIARCQGRLLVRLVDDDAWEVTFRDSVFGVTRTVVGARASLADDVLDEILSGMFRHRLRRSARSDVSLP